MKEPGRGLDLTASAFLRLLACRIRTDPRSLGSEQ